MFCRSANQTDSFLSNVSSPSAPRRLVGTGEDVPAVALAPVLAFDRLMANNSMSRNGAEPNAFLEPFWF